MPRRLAFTSVPIVTDGEGVWTSVIFALVDLQDRPTATDGEPSATVAHASSIEPPEGFRESCLGGFQWVAADSLARD
jgi:hypothetical protein